MKIVLTVVTVLFICAIIVVSIVLIFRFTRRDPAAKIKIEEEEEGRKETEKVITEIIKDNEGKKPIDGWVVVDDNTEVMALRPYHAFSGPKRPVIIVPGLGGSIVHNKWDYGKAAKQRLYDEVGATAYYASCHFSSKGLKWWGNPKWEQLWVNIQAALPDRLGGALCWRFRFAPDYIPGKGFINRPDLTADAWKTDPIDLLGNLQMSEDFGGTKGVDILLEVAGIKPKMAYMFHLFLKDLAAQGYQPMQSVFGAPYDFRRCTSKYYIYKYYKALKMMIENAVQKNNRKAVIIGHSLGCAVSKRFLSEYLPVTLGIEAAQQWKDKYVDIWMPIGSPIGGSSKALRTALSGDDEGLGALCVLYGGCNEWYQHAEKNISGLAWMVPMPELYQGADIVNVQSSSNSYNPSTNHGPLQELLHQAGAFNLATAYPAEVVPIYTTAYDPPGVKTVSIAGVTKPTEMSYTYSKINGKTQPLLTRSELDVYPTMKNMNAIQTNIMQGTNPSEMIGDGTVPWIVLHLAKIWQQTGVKPNMVNGKYMDVVTKDFVGANMDHKSMVDEPIVRQFMVDTILS